MKRKTTQLWTMILIFLWASSMCISQEDSAFSYLNITADFSGNFMKPKDIRQQLVVSPFEIFHESNDMYRHYFFLQKKPHID